MNHANNLNNFLYLTDFNTGVGYKLFGGHNKPSGSYTGNGSATSRTINTGGIGKFLMVYGNGCAGIVMPNGAIFIKGTTIKSFGSGHMTYGDGVLTINTDDEMVNANGKTFGYEVK